jgi:hypothetical protein
MCYVRSSLWLFHSSVQHFPASNALDPNRVSSATVLIQRLAPQAGASAERPAEAKPARSATCLPCADSQARRGLLTAPIPDPAAARFDVAEVAKGGCVDGCLPAIAGGHQTSHSETFANSLSLNDPPNIDRPGINRNLQSAMEVPCHQHLATKISPLEVS